MLKKCLVYGRKRELFTAIPISLPLRNQVQHINFSTVLQLFLEWHTGAIVNLDIYKYGLYGGKADEICIFL